MNKKYFGYTRVSTQKQGEKGVSLQEQKDAIQRYAGHGNLEITQWFEEMETAAKRGRPVFNQMMNLLRKGKADGIVIHKIDRSARNLKDWSDLGEMIDQGVEVHFANESLDLHSRGGRLSADIQAVVAADFIRNLREETKKGMYGRVKQGFYPWKAPLGYLDMGKAKVKEIDPEKGPLVKMAFELYVSGKFPLKKLAEEMYRLGLRNIRGRIVSINGLSLMLKNPFYVGIIRIKKTGEAFDGSHIPLVSQSLFQKVQDALRRRFNARKRKHDYLFRKMITCAGCGRSVIGERQRGNVYYRCHSDECISVTAREDAINEESIRSLQPLQLSKEEIEYARERIAMIRQDWNRRRQDCLNALNLRKSRSEERITRLTDAFVDRLIEKEIFNQKMTSLLMEKKAVEEKIRELGQTNDSLPDQLSHFLEIVENACFTYEFASQDEKRELLKTTTSNRRLDGKNVDLMRATPFDLVAKRFFITDGVPNGN